MRKYVLGGSKLPLSLSSEPDEQYWIVDANGHKIRRFRSKHLAEEWMLRTGKPEPEKKIQG